MNFKFSETEIPAGMTEGDAIELYRLTCKAAGLRATMSRRRIAGERIAHLAAALDATKSDLRDLTIRYA